MSPADQLYQQKDDAYFSRARKEIAPLLSTGGKLRALEVGCSQCQTLAWLKQEGYCEWVAGVEPFSQPDNDALAFIDSFSTVNIEEKLPDLPERSLDLILFLDVLEHLTNPWQTLRDIDCLLKPGGRFIISVPNIRNYHILSALLFKGRFDYTDDGILDRTHLRFFTLASAKKLAEASGAKVEAYLTTGLERPQKKLLGKLGLEGLLATQFILCAQKPY
jgi:SAM-dependent methyltransferase